MRGGSVTGVEVEQLQRGVSRVRLCDGPDRYEGVFLGSWLSGDKLVLVVVDDRQQRRDWWAEECEVIR